MKPEKDEASGEIAMVCPECGWKLTIRTNKANGTQFLGCTKYPECTFTRELTPYLQAKLAGHPILF